MKELDSNQLGRLTKVFRALFNTPTLIPRDDLVAKDLPGWDSFNHINLIINIEEEFNIRFTSEEVSGMQNIGDLKKVMTEKLSD